MRKSLSQLDADSAEGAAPKSLEAVRAEIDAIDRELVPLVIRRLRAVRDIAEAKRATGRAVYDPVREESILDAAGEAAGDDFSDEVKTVFRTLFDVAKSRQRAQLANTAKAGDLTLAIVGMGLIGGSFYKAARRAGYETVALHHGESEGLSRADVVLVCLPPDVIVPWVREHAARFRRGATVIDICGVKTAICRALAQLPKDGWRFVGGHPMAGKEVTGFANSTADLFLGKSMVLCPPEPRAGEPALERLFLSLGFAQVVVTTPAKHDEMIAFTSQLGHVIASAYAQDPRVAESVGFSAGSFANMSRIATIDPETWAALYLADRDALLAVLDGFMERLDAFRRALDAQDAPALKAFIAAGAAAKRAELDRARERLATRLFDQHTKT